MNSTTIVPWVVATFILFLIFQAFAFARKASRRAEEKGLMPPAGQKPTIDHVRAAANAGEKILAIKMYREIYGGGLKEAKEAVEKIPISQIRG